MAKIQQFLPSVAGGAGPVLAFESDGFRLRGALIKPRRGSPEVVGPYSSRSTDPINAISEILRQLKGQAGRLPKTVCLVSASAVGAIVDLPVTPDKPRPKAQMREMIRWELEPQFAQQNELWMIGAIMEGRGFLTRAQRHEIAVDLETQAAGGKRLIRFGEMAVEKNFITREQLDECLMLREKLVVADDDIACGWQPIENEEMDGSIRVSWYVCGIGESIRKQWSAAFSRNGLRLAWIYPLAGTAFAALNHIAQPESQRILIQIQQEQITCIRGEADRIITFRSERRSVEDVADDPSIAICQEEMRPGIERVCLQAEDTAPAADLGQRLGREVMPLPEGNEVLLGAGLHMMGLASSQLAVRLEASDPAPPLWKNPDVIRIAIAASVLLVIIGVEAGNRWRLVQFEGRLASLNQQFDETLTLNKALERTNREIQDLQEQIAVRQAELADYQTKLNIVENILLARRDRVPDILAAVQDSINEEVVLDSIEERKGTIENFTLAGWALSDTSGQLFISKLDRNLEALGLTVAEEKLRRGRSRLEMDGFVLELRIVPRPPRELVGQSPNNRETGG